MDVSKLFLALTGYCKEDMIAFFSPFDLLEGVFIVSLGYDSFQHGGVTGFIKAKVKVNSKSMRIVVISEKS